MLRLLLFPLLLAVAVVAAPPKGKGTQWQGTISNGMKGDKLSFVVSADGKRISQLTFSGYWRCGGKLEQTTVGPDGSFTVQNGQVKGALVEPPQGGSTAWRYDLQGRFTGKTVAQGTFRMNINGLGCDTHLLQWKAAPAGR
ncbi:hypothetical protein [Hymenobacter sp. B81]|uniref:hypothetical protein n=1 Tax=Hymenobacter sp. B81 TaxID=3344878 RepID=UPI0037DC2A3A